MARLSQFLKGQTALTSPGSKTASIEAFPHTLAAWATTPGNTAASPSLNSAVTAKQRSSPRQVHPGVCCSFNHLIVPGRIRFSDFALTTVNTHMPVDINHSGV